MSEHWDKAIEAMARAAYTVMTSRMTLLHGAPLMASWDEAADILREDWQEAERAALDALTTGPLFEEMARKFAHHMGNNLASIREKEALRAALGAREA